MTTEIEVRSFGDFTLFERHASGEWTNYVLRTNRPPKRGVSKAGFYFGWNGRRFSGTVDLKYLGKHFPEKMAELNLFFEAAP